MELARIELASCDCSACGFQSSRYHRSPFSRIAHVVLDAPDAYICEQRLSVAVMCYFVLTLSYSG